MKNNIISPLCLLALLTLSNCEDHRIPVEVPPLTISTLAVGLVAPIGVESDPSGRLFVSESGTGKNDSRIMFVATDGKTYPVVTGLPSAISPGGEPGGTDHLLYADGVLYAFNGGILYKIKVSGYMPGDIPIAGSTLVGEDIGAWVVNYKFVNDTNDSHPYNMVIGPDGAMYITDAAANAIIRRDKTGALSVLTEVPAIKNPTPVGPPFIEAVPTGITYDGTKFLIGTLVGFPFPAAQSTLYRMDLLGKLTVQQQGFTSVVDVENDGSGGALVLEYGTFGAMGWNMNTGRLLQSSPAGNKVLFDKLNQPTDLKIVDAHTAYMTILGDGTLQKISY
ncbi:ScyD/ScyE family protein [Persicitalea sp.]|uniref:ScyD/ScyE family protein n=1 Tax=Persicitalea sp. TaxID=3100273 RepID=UPI003593BA5E